MNDEKIVNPELDKTMDAIIDPIVVDVFNLFVEFSAKGNNGVEELKSGLNELIGVAVLKGLEITLGYQKKIDDEFDKQISNMETRETMSVASNGKELAAKLSMNDATGNFRRFVSPLDLDENGKLKKG